MYLTSTRLDNMHVFSLISKYMKNPIEVHLLVAKRIFHYLKDIIDFGTLYKNGGNSSLIGFSDSDYARDLDDRRSAFGSMFIFNFGVVTWSSKKKKVVTL